MTWKVAYDDPKSLRRVEHLEGTDWYSAPAPPAGHECFAQTRAWLEDGYYLERCPCGSFGPKPFTMLRNDKPRVARAPKPGLLERLGAIFVR